MSKVRWRRAWFQVHKWIGLVLAALIVPLSLSGAALVWREPLDRLLHPARYAVTGSAVRPPDDYVRAAAPQLQPGERVAQLSTPIEGPAVLFAAPASASARPGPPVRRMVYMDGRSARVLDVAMSDAGALRFVHVLHGSLQIPGGWGRSIVGWLGVAMMLSAFTGLWLWWPMVGSMRRALRWGRHRNLDTNIHQTFGFWIALPLFVLSLTGAWISFPAFFGALVGQGRPPGPDRAMQARARPVARARLPVGEVAVRAIRAAGGGAPVQFTWPTERKPDWSVRLARPTGEPATVSVADDDGVAVLTPAPAGQGRVARLMRGVHDGSVGGPVWQAIVFIGGLVPAALAVTGVVMWWRARRWRRAAMT